MNTTEIGWAPHLISVELIRALILVSIGVGVHAVEEGVAGLEAQFAIEVVAMEVAHEEEAIVLICHFSRSIIIIIIFASQH